ncbi:FMN reductase [Krasilnikoviella flava]|uniref:FMN reductase n=1 Tax=Krasilnikoviella flava TaxID=526729 RepID=A0A1T5L589_9MICO|nr:FMN reductase [Krasilnikoviella flava]SKC71141.1 FMN reductase [Krasilnikoviella flava]
MTTPFTPAGAGGERTLAVVSAGLSQPSSTRLLADRLADATVRELEDAGYTVRVETIELRDLAHAVVDAMLTRFPTGDLARALETVTGADGLIAVSPVFTTSYSGLFKSFWDVVDPDSLTGMPVLLGATGGTARHSLALEYAVRPLFTYLRADVVPTSVFAATDDWAASADPSTGSGGPDVGGLPKRISRAGRELAARMSHRENEGPVDPFAATPSFTELLGGS